MLSFFIGVVATLVALLIVGASLTRGWLLAFVWFAIIIGINKLLGRNPFS